MRTFKPLVKIKNKWVEYPSLTIDKSIVFGERQLKRNQTVAFKTESFGVIEILSLDDLKEVRL